MKLFSWLHQKEEKRLRWVHNHTQGGHGPSLPSDHRQGDGFAPKGTDHTYKHNKVVGKIGDMQTGFLAEVTWLPD